MTAFGTAIRRFESCRPNQTQTIPSKFPGLRALVPKERDPFVAVSREVLSLNRLDDMRGPLDAASFGTLARAALVGVGQGYSGKMHPAALPTHLEDAGDGGLDPAPWAFACRPSVLTAAAMVTVTETMRPFWRTFKWVASSQR